MGKRAKKNRQIEKKVVTVHSPKVMSNAGSETVDDNVDNGVKVVKERRACPHLVKGIEFDKLSTKLRYSEPIRCEDCREGGRGSKGKHKAGRKKAGVADAKSESKAIWICLECGHYACAGVGLPTASATHAIRHIRQTRHHLMIQWDNPQLRWCFPCSTFIPVEKSEENGESEDILSQVVKLIKDRSSELSAADVEDVLSATKSEAMNCLDRKSKSEALNCLDRKNEYVVRGLVNLGNTCFFNSVMQNLLALDRLRDYFFNLCSSYGKLTFSLKSLFAETNLEMGSKKAINPKFFFGSICAKASQFNDNQQHDSHELLHCLLDGLSTEELVLKKCMSTSDSAYRDKTFVDAAFGGQISSTLCCVECGHSSIIYEPFLDLSLSVPTKKSSSKKVEPVSRVKKTKLPPRKVGKTLENVSKYAYRVPISLVASESPSTLAVPQTDSGVASLGDYSLSVVIGPSPEVNELGFTSQNLLAVTEYENEQVMEKTVKANTAVAGEFSWMDYRGTDNILQENAAGVDEFTWMDYYDSRDHDLVSKNNDTSHFFGSQISEEPQTDSGVASSGDYSLSVVIGPSPEVNELGFTSQNLLAVTEYENEQVMGKTMKANTTGAGEFSWMDYQGTDNILQENAAGVDEFTWMDYYDSRDHNLVSKNNDTSLFFESQISEEPNSSGNLQDEEELPLLIQESQVLFLPYKEEITSTEETVKENGASLSNIDPDHEQEEVEFDGFSDMFNEPEIAVGSSSGSVVTETGILGLNISESDPDEVEDRDFPVSVESCLTYFIKPELLSEDNAWNCKNCVKTLLHQKLEVKKKQTKMYIDLVNGGESPSLDKEDSCSNGAIINGGISSSGESLVSQIDSCNQNSNEVENGLTGELNSIVSGCEEGKSKIEDASLMKPNSSISIQPVGSCNVSQLAESGEDEEIDSESVKVKKNAIKRVLIDKAPPILTIHLKRFSQDTRGRLSKLNGHVKFRETIDLRPYVDPRCGDIESCIYHLVGVVEHLGTMRHGHYIAYVRGGEKRSGKTETEYASSPWYYASDQHVRQVSLEEVLRSEAYILFYEKN